MAQKQTKVGKKNVLGLWSRHIDIEVNGREGDPLGFRSMDIERAVGRETDKWHKNGKFKEITSVSVRTYHTHGKFTHWLDAWVPVDRELPDDEMTVLVALEGGEVWTGFMDAGQWRYVSADLIGEKVTHWAEFPEPPKDATA